MNADNEESAPALRQCVKDLIEGHEADATMSSQSINDLIRQALRVGAVEENVDHALEQPDVRGALITLIRVWTHSGIRTTALQVDMEAEVLQQRVEPGGKCFRFEEVNEILQTWPEYDSYNGTPLAKLSIVRSPLGTTLIDCIASGLLKSLGGLGILLADEHALHLFDEVLRPRIHNMSLGQLICDADIPIYLASPTIPLRRSDVVLSTRIRLARNLKGYPFPPAMRPEDRIAVQECVASALTRVQNELCMDPCETPLPPTNGFLADVGVFADWPTSRSAYTSETGGIWVNEEDHVRLFSVERGFQPVRVCHNARRLHDCLTGLGRLEFARNQYGYLTSCPSNLGTGARLSVRVKLSHALDDPIFDATLRYAGLSRRSAAGEMCPIENGIIDLDPAIRLSSMDEQVHQIICGVNLVSELDDDAGYLAKQNCGRTALTPTHHIQSKLKTAVKAAVPVVLFSCGSYHPVHVGHILMMEYAKCVLENPRFREAWPDSLREVPKLEVVGGYISPEHQSYVDNKHGLDRSAPWRRKAPSMVRRTTLVGLAVVDQPWLSVTCWQLCQSFPTGPEHLANHLIERLSSLPLGDRVALVYVCGDDQCSFPTSVPAFVVSRKPIAPGSTPANLGGLKSIKLSGAAWRSVSSSHHVIPNWDTVYHMASLINVLPRRVHNFLYERSSEYTKEMELKDCVEEALASLHQGFSDVLAQMGELDQLRGLELQTLAVAEYPKAILAQSDGQPTVVMRDANGKMKCEIFVGTVVDVVYTDGDRSHCQVVEKLDVQGWVRNVNIKSPKASIVANECFLTDFLSGRAIASVPMRTSVTVLKSSGAKIQVQLPQGPFTTGWVHHTALDFAPDNCSADLGILDVPHGVVLPVEHDQFVEYTSLASPAALNHYSDHANIQWLSFKGGKDYAAPCGLQMRKLQRCQTLQHNRPDIFVCRAEVRQRLVHSRPVDRFKKRPFIAVSHPWWSADEPDPRGAQCRAINKLILVAYHYSPDHGCYHWATRHEPAEIAFGLDAAVFIDFCCLPQKPRGEDEIKLFKLALKNMHMLYAHDCTDSFLMDLMPNLNYPNSTPYEERGWCHFEACVSRMSRGSTFCMHIHFGLRAGSLLREDIKSDVASAPTPDEFRAKLKDLAFAARGSDLKMVGDLYEKVYQCRFRDLSTTMVTH